MKCLLILAVLPLLAGCTSSDVTKLVDAGTQMMVAQSQQSMQQNYGYRYYPPQPPRYYHRPYWDDRRYWR